MGGLELGATYWFALRSVDSDSDWSALSNVVSASTDSIDDRLLAYYPLVANAEDATGHYGPITLTHTPFQDGGIYSNGIYVGDDAVNGALAITPSIDSLDFGAFTIRARFRVEDYAAQPGNPVFIGGSLYRWIGYYVEADSTVSLMFGGGSRQGSDVVYTTGTWYEGTVTYDGTTARLYLDGTFACERTATIDPGADRNVGTSNGSTGYAFEGLFGRLAIYDGVVTP